jgi:adenylate kinase
MKLEFDTVIVAGKSGSGKQPRIDVLKREFGLEQLSTGDIFRHYLGLFNEIGFEGSLDTIYDEAKETFISDEEIKKTLGLSGDESDSQVLGAKAKYFVEKGKFVPDDITNALLASAFEKMDYKKTVLDGFPRTLDQAKFLCDLVKEKNIKLDGMILVENEDELIIKRTVDRRLCPNCKELYHLQYRPPVDNKTCEKCGTDVIQRNDDTTEKIKSRLQEFHTKTVPALEYLEQQGVKIYRVPGNLPTYAPEAVTESVMGILQAEADK